MTMPPTKIRVLIADDHVYVADGVQSAVEAYGDVEIVAKVQDLEQLGEKIKEFAPDVVILDIMFRDKQTGIHFATRYLKKHPDTKIIIFSQYDDDNIILAAFDAGALSFLSKNALPETLYEAIKTVSLGNIFIAPEVAPVLLKNLSSKTEIEVNPRLALSEREYQIFILSAQGLTLSEISEEMQVGERTVSKGVANIKKILNLERIGDFTKLALKNKLIG